MLTPQQNKYLAASIQTASPAQLLIMLYDGAIRYCRMGIEALKHNKYDEVNRALCKAQEIIRELAITVDQSYPIADHLINLYDYYVFRLIEANTQKKAQPVEEVLGYLIELKETWIQAAKIAASNPSAKVTHG